MRFAGVNYGVYYKKTRDDKIGSVGGGVEGVHASAADQPMLS